jgi:hypothetical protein
MLSGGGHGAGEQTPAMSLLELKQSIRELTPAERREVSAFVAELEAAPEGERRVENGRKMTREESRKHIFTHYGDLLSRLAK